MNRRDLNRILMIGTALAGGWPGWLRRAFGAESAPPRDCPAPSGQAGLQRWRQIVATAYRRAQKAGKPLLAFVVPSVDEDSGRGFEKRWDRGQAFGELLNHGGDEALATLALAEIVCAPMTALRTLAPSLSVEPLMVLVETDAVPARARALDAPLPQFPVAGSNDPLAGLNLSDEGGQPPPDWDAIFEKERQAEDEVVRRRIQVVSSLLDGGLRATPQMLLERAAQAQGRLGLTDGLASVPENAGPAELHRMAPVLLAAAVGLPDRDRQPAVRRVADAARAVLCRRRVPGSRWANSSGCGTHVEREPGEDEEEGLLFACGMGHVPEQSRRFLDFLTADAVWRSRS
jgi:hypothetical protein